MLQLSFPRYCAIHRKTALVERANLKDHRCGGVEPQYKPKARSMDFNQPVIFARGALAGRVAVVTGGSSGIGLETVRLLLHTGAAVAFCGRDRERLDLASSTLRAEFPAARIHASICDVQNSDSIAAFAENCEANLGAASMLVNNAGQGRISTFSDTDDDAWMQEMRLKFFSVIHPVRAFLQQLQMQRQVWGDASVVCVNSLLARQPEPHMVATSAARAGILNLVRSMATEFAPDRIRVNGILVGLVESGQWRRRFGVREDTAQTWDAWSAGLARDKSIPLGRLGQPQEAASAIVFLASPMASYTTGSHIDISGGLSRHA